MAGKAVEAVGNSVESLYATFTNTVLPAVGQGLVITKDYFVDLFSRYAMYLAITDGLMALTEIAAIVWAIHRFKLTYKTYSNGESRTTDSQDMMHVLGFVAAICVVIIATVWLTTDLPNFVKDLLVPEFRVGEQLLKFKASLGK